MLSFRLFALILLASTAACPERTWTVTAPSLPAEQPATSGIREEPDLFSTSVLPVLERRCTPCHFTGGVMHAKLPFDDPATIRRIGEHLFARIKDPGEQQAIREFLTSADLGRSSIVAEDGHPGAGTWLEE